ncbi:molecular chaperone TorD family protein [Vibrio tapetis subsp. quintayensis]|uniref:TorD/DmsD family molecular chaperone n=1 Tax=Vibrio tapetis TaxID=52443 RepID=UPI0025B50E43|nr:molecular chaperone TorD family protein [Vibrio tapetis]MDN3679156.1 molecular chaperone TorD family protein [Vibrio tapetis subsp. quintayensis]
MTQETQSVRADIYNLIATLLRQAPNQELLNWLAEIEVEGANEQPMAKAWQALSSAAKATTEEHLIDEYQHLFIGIGRGEVMPFASWHITGSLMEKPLALLRNDLIQLGFERAEGTKEPEDHFAALCEVMALLETEKEQYRFFNRHIQSWYLKLTDQIRSAENSQFYCAVSDLIDQFLLIEQTRFAAVPVRETKFATSGIN